MTSSLSTPTATATKPLRAADPASLTDAQRSVLRAFYEFGTSMDDTALAVYVHHIENDPQSSSSVRSRRAELTRGNKPLLRATGVKQRPGRRSMALHGLTPRGKKLAAKLFS